ncbi:MAG: hypothetical protein K2X39_02330 [Silvanigrellaceae bacterium]|nr:hypothetical protein [Silvanigrellaceae bacterium]
MADKNPNYNLFKRRTFYDELSPSSSQPANSTDVFDERTLIKLREYLFSYQNHPHQYQDKILKLKKLLNHVNNNLQQKNSNL